jgi:hypothetical protein
MVAFEFSWSRFSSLVGFNWFTAYKVRISDGSDPRKFVCHNQESCGLRHASAGLEPILHTTGGVARAGVNECTKNIKKYQEYII